MICVFAFLFFIFGFSNSAFAKEVTVLYTGETHAMLYPCNCPIEPDGGVARRATLIKELRSSNPDMLLLDSGSFFAGGLMDQYTQNTQLDIQRTNVNVKAMELMQYDAVAIGDAEFNFSREFLEENINRTNLTYLSSNIKFNPGKVKALPYIIKVVSGIKVGITSVTTLSAVPKAGGLEFIEPKLALKQAIDDLKRQGANLIILLSGLSEGEDLELIREIPAIDILINGRSHNKEETSNKIGATLILRPSWQGRRLGKLSLTLKDNQIITHKTEELRLSDKISDDPEIVSILPRCFSDANCKEKGLMGTCQDPGTLNSRCLFSKPAKVSLLIITAKSCTLCQTEPVVNYLKPLFPGLIVSYLYYPDVKANNLIKALNIKGLPVYLLGKESEKESGFISLKEKVDAKGNFYILKPQAFGMSYFLNRKKIPGKLDLFLSLYDKNAVALLEAVKDFNPALHFLVVRIKDRLDAKAGPLEAEEYLRSVCVQKYYPQKFWDYITCRAKFINSSWWEDCLGKLEVSKIKTCARDIEGELLLEENINLNKELEIMVPAYLVDNQEIFSTKGVPTKKELEEILKR